LHLAEHVPHPRPQRAVHAACRAEVSPRCRRQVDRASLCWTAQRTARAFGSSAAAHDLLGLSGREKKTQTRLSANMRRPDAGPRGFLGCRSEGLVGAQALQRPTVQALRLLNVHQASLIHHSDVLARGRVRRSMRHERRKNCVLLNKPVFLSLVALLRPDHVPHHCATVPDGCTSSHTLSPPTIK